MSAASIILTSIFCSILVGSLVLVHESAIIFQETLMGASMEASREAVNASILTKGINPLDLKGFEQVTNPQKALIVKNIQQNDGSIFQLVGKSEDEIIGAVGFSIQRQKKDESFAQKGLNPPTFRYSGVLSEEWFDMANLIIPAEENPSGTYYRHTLDDNPPNEGSSIWKNQTFTPENIPQRLFVRSYHVDGIYTPSIAEAVTFQMPAPELLVLRENGTANLGVSILEIKNSYNKIILKSKSNPTLFNIYYAFNNNRNWILYEEPFHVGFEFWTKEGTQLNVKISPKSPHFSDVYYETIALRVIKHKLSNPIFTPGPSEELVRGDTVKILNPNKEGNSCSGSIQFGRTGVGFAETIHIQTEQ